MFGWNDTMTWGNWIIVNVATGFLVATVRAIFNSRNS